MIVYVIARTECAKTYETAVIPNGAKRNEESLYLSKPMT